MRRGGFLSVWGRGLALETAKTVKLTVSVLNIKILE